MKDRLEILNRLNEHLESALKTYPDKDWFVICAQGSWNYNLADEESDVDTKLLIIPSFEDIVLNHKPISTTHILENDEHVDVKDIREYFKLFEKANINFVEILFTDYWICNEKYSDLWLELLEHREEIARMNPYNALSCMKGMASEKVHALCHEYPSRMYYIEKYGYDGKQLSHLKRIEDFVLNYTSGKPYIDCVWYEDDEPGRDWIMKLKRHTAGVKKEEAVRYADILFKNISAEVNIARSLLDKQSDPKVVELLNKIMAEVLRRSLKESILGEENDD